MYFYYCIFFFLTFISFWDIFHLAQKNRKTVYFIIIFIAVFFVGGRYSCDNDYKLYESFYRETPTLGNQFFSNLWQQYLIWQIEPGYILSCFFLKSIGLGPQSIFVVCSILTFGAIAKSFSQISLYPLLSFFLFFTSFFTLSFVQMRFGVATACVLYALVHLDNQNKRGYRNWMIIGLLFHMTALVGFLVYWIYRIKITRKKSLMFLFCSFLLTLIPTRVLFVNIVSWMGFSRYLVYAHDDSGDFFSIIFLIILLLPFIYYEPILRVKIKHYHLLLVLGVSSVLIACIVREVPILNRFSLLLSASYCVILPSYLELLKKNSSIFIGWILLVIYSYLKFLPSLKYVQDYQNAFLI